MNIILTGTFQGVTSVTHRYPKTVTVTVEKLDQATSSGGIVGTSIQVFQFPMTSDAFGTYSTSGFLPVTPGVYNIRVKGPAHLEKEFTNITLPSPNGTYTINWVANPMKAGDIAGQPNGGPDNMIDASDLGLLISRFSPLQPLPVAQTWDLNDDGVIDITDIGILLSNLRPGVYGDNETQLPPR